MQTDDDVIRLGQHTMTVCNACRYCEQYCPVFQAMESRLAFARTDLTYLANLCHNCGECLYACQYAPPHEFGINVPRTLAQVRVLSYEEYCWPRPLAAAFRKHGLLTGLVLSLALSLAMLAGTWLVGGNALARPETPADFYAVMPHGVMVGLFGTVSAFILIALAVGITRFWRDQRGHAMGPIKLASIARALRDAVTLRHLHTDGVDCTSAEEERHPWRRWFHHATLYGFMLCFASTSVAAVYHSWFGWEAPYGYTSLPVVLGTVGGLGLVIGPAGLFVLSRRRDSDLGDPEQRGLNDSFIALLFLTSLTGLLLLALRESGAMGMLLIVHLGVVLALFVTMPYGKFVHGLYRTAALVKYAIDTAAEETDEPVRNPVAVPPHDLRAPAGVRGQQALPLVKTR